MEIQKTIFYKDQWRWSEYLKYVIFKLNEYQCLKKDIPAQFSYKDSFYGSKNSRKNVTLSTWAAFHQRIKFARAVCINSPNYSVFNFLIIPNYIYNFPFLGIDFVSLPNYHLLVLDFQPSLNIERQLDQEILDRIIKIKDNCHKYLPHADEMNMEVKQFFSPGLIWSKLPKKDSSDLLISNQLYYAFKEYLKLYLNILYKSNEVDPIIQKEIIEGQNYYLSYRRDKDPARPMLSSLFGKDFTESLINNFLFTST